MRFSVSREKEAALTRRMKALGIRETDIVERFILAGKKGGQKVNKTATCVYLKHRQSGIEVKCQLERSQPLNRYLARRILAGKVESLARGRESAEEKAREKLRRQKRRRSRRAKEKVLRLKKMRSERKELRRTPAEE